MNMPQKSSKTSYTKPNIQIVTKISYLVLLTWYKIMQFIFYFIFTISVVATTVWAHGMRTLCVRSVRNHGGHTVSAYLPVATKPLLFFISYFSLYLCFF
jgi:hypothetical protein